MQHPFVNEKPLNKSELNIKGSLFFITPVEEIPLIRQYLLYVNQSSFFKFSIINSSSQTIRRPSFVDLGSQNEMFAQVSSQNTARLFYQRNPAFSQYLYDQLLSFYWIMAEGQTTWIFGHPSAQLKPCISTCLFQVYFFRCFIKIFDVYFETSIQSSSQGCFFDPLIALIGLKIIASVITLPFGFKNSVYMAILVFLLIYDF